MQEMAASFFSFAQQNGPRGCKMTNRDPSELPAAFSMLKKMANLQEMAASWK